MNNALLAEIVDIRRWLKEDADTPYDQRLARDRKIGRQLSVTRDSARVRAWWQAVQPDSENSPGTRLIAAARLATAALTGLGFLLGTGIGSVAFAFDGRHPVNLLALIGVLVGVPLLLLALSLLFLVPGRIPGLRGIRDALSVINPGRWLGAWLDRFLGLRLYGGFASGASGFARWQLVVFSQWFAIGYFLGVLLAGWVLVAVTDLAFGWSTTLALDAGVVHQLFATLALPWQGWLNIAVPDLALVEASRFYRLETDPVTLARALQLGQWWPFVLMTILTWGLMPRLLLLWLGRWRLSAAIRGMLCQDPEVVALIDRLARPHVDFGPEENAELPAESGSTPPPPVMQRDETAGILLWNDALDEDQARRWMSARLGTSGGALVKIGVRQTSPEIKSRVTQLGKNLSRILLFTKGWEPPLLEFADFLALLRSLVGKEVSITVIPIDTRRTGVLAADRAVWASFLARHADPRLYVFQVTEDTAT